MSIFNFTNHLPCCQKGFLLLEAVVTLCALSALMLGVASWYSTSVRSQRFIRERLQAMHLASSSIEKYQSMQQLPVSESFTHDGYSVQIIVQRDTFLSNFYWIKLLVSKDGKTYAEYNSGVLQKVFDDRI